MAGVELLRGQPQHAFATDAPEQAIQAAEHATHLGEVGDFDEGLGDFGEIGVPVVSHVLVGWGSEFKVSPARGHGVQRSEGLARLEEFVISQSIAVERRPLL